MGSIAFVLATLALPVSEAAASPVLWSYPSSCGGALTLQACIDAVSPGDGIEIDTNTPIAQGVVIDKSLDLMAASGFTPSVSAASVSGGAETVNVRVSGITFGNRISVHFYAGSGHFIDIDRVKVTASTTAHAAIGLSATVPASMTVRRSVVTGFNHQSVGILVSTSHNSGTVSASVVGNRVSGKGFDFTGSGIAVNAYGDGATNVDVMNNSVRSVASCSCGGSSGILVYRGGIGSADVNLVGNTVVKVAGSAFYTRDWSTRDLSTGGNSLTVDLFNNIAAFSYRGVAFQSMTPGLRTVRAGFNNVWRNDERDQWDGESKGAGHLKVDPRFVDLAKGSLQLRARSPLIDAGRVCSPGGVAIEDARGQSRVAGPSVDIGGYERGSGPADGVARVGTAQADTLVGTSGADILCGMSGDDDLDGMTGNDYVDGGGGDDYVVGGPGRDRLLGGPGRDVVIGGTGADRLFGGDGADRCLDAKDGAGGNDVVDGGRGIDHYRADSGDAVRNAEQRGCVS